MNGHSSSSLPYLKASSTSRFQLPQQPENQISTPIVSSPIRVSSLQSTGLFTPSKVPGQSTSNPVSKWSATNTKSTQFMMQSISSLAPVSSVVVEANISSWLVGSPSPRSRTPSHTSKTGIFTLTTSPAFHVLSAKTGSASLISSTYDPSSGPSAHSPSSSISVGTNSVSLGMNSTVYGSNVPGFSSGMLIPSSTKSFASQNDFSKTDTGSSTRNTVIATFGSNSYLSITKPSILSAKIQASEAHNFVTSSRSKALGTANALFKSVTHEPTSVFGTSHPSNLPSESGIAVQGNTFPTGTVQNGPSEPCANVLASQKPHCFETPATLLTSDWRLSELTVGIKTIETLSRGPTEGKPNAQTASHVSSAFTASITPALTTEITAIYPASTLVAEGGSAQSHVFGSGAVQVTVGSMAAGSVLFLVLFGLIRWRNKRKNKEQHEWAGMVPSRSTVSSQYDPINPNPFLLTEEIVGYNNIHENGGYMSSARPTQYLGSFMKSPYSS